MDFSAGEIDIGERMSFIRQESRIPESRIASCGILGDGFARTKVPLCWMFRLSRTAEVLLQDWRSDMQDMKLVALN